MRLSSNVPQLFVRYCPCFTATLKVLWASFLLQKKILFKSSRNSWFWYCGTHCCFCIVSCIEKAHSHGKRYSWPDVVHKRQRTWGKETQVGVSKSLHLPKRTESPPVANGFLTFVIPSHTRSLGTGEGELPALGSWGHAHLYAVKLLSLKLH
jgi:hypothetical protein